MNNRNYPLFIIDRSQSDNYPFDYVVCLDKEVGFVCSVIAATDDNTFQALVSDLVPADENAFKYFTMRLKRGGILLFIEDFLQDIETVSAEQKARIQVLMKKAAKKYQFSSSKRETKPDQSTNY